MLNPAPQNGSLFNPGMGPEEARKSVARSKSRSLQRGLLARSRARVRSLDGEVSVRGRTAPSLVGPTKKGQGRGKERDHDVFRLRLCSC